MAKVLKRNYFCIIIPALLALAAAYGAKALGLVSGTPGPVLKSLPFLAPLVFVLSVVFAVALPIFYRSVFAHRMRDEKTVSEKDLLKFERTLIHISLVTPYLILPAYLFEFPRFYFAGTVLMALYAGYYFYPSGRRIQFERRMFRVR
ncbi:MAG: hypothetical protein U5R49_08390 [Deltaproteobacteria bacterium]|nr:hypothetical protein [Deltaproteobacteria bacterium]